VGGEEVLKHEEDISRLSFNCVFYLWEKELNTIAIEVKESYTILKNYITR
jgi:hypothetical protein